MLFSTANWQESCILCADHTLLKMALIRVMSLVSIIYITKLILILVQQAITKPLRIRHLVSLVNCNRSGRITSWLSINWLYIPTILISGLFVWLFLTNWFDPYPIQGPPLAQWWCIGLLTTRAGHQTPLTSQAWVGNRCHSFILCPRKSLTWLNTLRLRQNGRHSADNILKCISLNENVWILNRISLKYVPWGLIGNMTALVQIMALHQTGNRPLSEAVLECCTDAYMCHSAAMSQTHFLFPITRKREPKVFWECV